MSLTLQSFTPYGNPFQAFIVNNSRVLAWDTKVWSGYIQLVLLNFLWSCVKLFQPLNVGAVVNITAQMSLNLSLLCWLVLRNSSTLSLEVNKYTISLLVGSSSNYACSHHSDKLGSWNSSSCRQLCTHWRILVRFFSWFCVSYPSPVWLAGAPASSSRCSTDVQAHSVSIHISGGVSDSAYCRVSDISLANWKIGKFNKFFCNPQTVALKSTKG